MNTLKKQNQIMDIAEALFCKHGSKETTVRLITQQAGINTAMLNYYFKSKENLFLMVIERRIKQFKTLKKSLRPKDKSILEEFLAYTQFYIDLIANNLPFYRLMMAEKLLNENKNVVNAINLFFYSNIKTLKTIIEKGIQENKIEVTEIETILMNVAGVLVYAILKSDDVTFPLNDLNKLKLQGHIRAVLVGFVAYNLERG
ncbi:TetR family transcriptional regulator [Flavobacterium sp. 270]|uniref:TetR/AcrR family transcriptional regulator n=1 Tax=Flavobacterium sp. 270 TaxID=2512114 RepID=UPI00106665E2|nr:TetR/AcrR family transcriptional regulator [Flavobacterium sp. 270]TDW51836.1 TetR family transcriptional regulator [Flavobacterium sp. 270]